MRAEALVLFLLWRSADAAGGTGEQALYHEGSRTLLVPDSDSSAFGYSVLLQNSADPRLVAGAPSSINKGLSYDRTDDVYPGEVYSCALSLQPKASNASCQPDIRYDDGLATLKNTDYSSIIETMSLGATLTEVYDGSLVICAPKWSRQTRVRDGDVYRDERAVNGLCYVVTEKYQHKETLKPLADPDRQSFKKDSWKNAEPYFAYGQAGFSAATSPDRRWLLLGAPGLMLYTGGVVKYKVKEGLGKGSQSVFDLLPTTNPIFTNSLKQDSYFGYAVAVGIFEESEEMLGVAGAPRSRDGLGEVYVFGLEGNETDPLDVRANLTGSQLYEYFGAALLVADVNGDGRADLLVGAPQNAVSIPGAACCYDQGAVYVYINKKEENGFSLELQSVLTGSGVSGAKFGSSLVDLGDVNGDGYRDIAVGAPWEGPDDAGAVYIYRGGQLGFNDAYIQRISPNIPELKGFGFSIAQGVDLDKNGCPELAVGSVAGSMTGTAAVFRCAPTLVVRGSVELLGVPTMRMRAGVVGVPRNLTALTFRYCVSTADAARWPAASRGINATISLHLNTTNFELIAKPGEVICQNRSITIDESVPYIVSRLDLQATPDKIRDAISFDPYYARLDNESTLHTAMEVYFIDDCGDDLICNPDLRINFTSLTGSRFVPGRDENLGVAVIVYNMGETAAYGGCVKISLPSPPLRTPQGCKLNSKELTCSLAHPFRRYAEAEWTIELQKGTHLTNQSLVFSSTLFETCEDIITSVQNLTVHIEPMANITIEGRSDSNVSLLTVPRANLIEGAYMDVTHTYELKNHGPSDWPNVTIVIVLPSKVPLSELVPDCVNTSSAESRVLCSWSPRAREKRIVQLRLRFYYLDHEIDLRAHDRLPVTTQAAITYGETNNSAEVTNWLTLGPRPAIWPIILAVLFGLLLIALIAFILYKTGFFVRSKKQELEKLKEGSAAGGELSERARRASTSASELLDEDFNSIATSEPLTPSRLAPTAVWYTNQERAEPSDWKRATQFGTMERFV